MRTEINMHNVIILSRNSVGAALHKVLSTLLEQTSVLYSDECAVLPQDPASYILAGTDFRRAIRDIAEFRNNQRAWRGIIYYCGVSATSEQMVGTPFLVFPENHKCLPFPLDLHNLIDALNIGKTSEPPMIDNRSQTYFRLIATADAGAISFRDMVVTLQHSLGHLEEDHRRNEPPGHNWFKTVTHVAGLLMWDGRFASKEAGLLTELDYNQFRNSPEIWIGHIRTLMTSLEKPGVSH
jgi:hypothetical protein